MKNIVKITLCLIFAYSLQAGDLISYDNNIKANGKNVILILGSSSCSYCDAIRKDINEDKQLNALIKDKVNVYYVPVDKQVTVMMGDKTPQLKTTSVSLKMQFGSRNTPNIIMFNKNWKRIIQIPGYATPKQMKVFVKYLNDNIYETKDLTTYLKELHENYPFRR